MTKRKSIKGQTTIYTTLPRKLKIMQHEPHLKPRLNAGFLLYLWHLLTWKSYWTSFLKRLVFIFLLFVSVFQLYNGKNKLYSMRG